MAEHHAVTHVINEFVAEQKFVSSITINGIRLRPVWSQIGQVLEFSLEAYRNGTWYKVYSTDNPPPV